MREHLLYKQTRRNRFRRRARKKIRFTKVIINQDDNNNNGVGGGLQVNFARENKGSKKEIGKDKKEGGPSFSVRGRIHTWQSTGPFEARGRGVHDSSSSSPQEEGVPRTEVNTQRIVLASLSLRASTCRGFSLDARLSISRVFGFI